MRHGTESLCGINQVYQAATQERAEANRIKLEQTWCGRYRAAIRSWQSNWEDLSTFFEFTQEIRRLIYTTNTVEGYHRQLWKVLKNEVSFPPEQAVQKSLYLVARDIIQKWTAPIRNWPLILNQLAIRFKTGGHSEISFTQDSWHHQTLFRTGHLLPFTIHYSPN